MNFNYRYPGSSPFEDNDYDRMLFFGRDREKQALFHLVMSERLSVLFAKSGIGKTSLIHAGINQMFRDKGFIPLVIRFHVNYADPFEAVYKTIEDIANPPHPSPLPGGEREHIEYIPGKQGSLWEYFKTVEFWTSGDALLSPVVIFDQFEEFFAVYLPEKRKEFIRALADLVRNRIPAELRQPDTPFPYSETPPDVRILIAIREDYLGLLEELADDIPHIFQNRFRLMPLNKEQAKEAITKPAELKDERIKSSGFKYEDDALDAILEYLSKRKERDGIKIVNEVESFQLQLICRHIENGISEKSDKQHEVVITKQDLSGMPDVLQKFYEEQLNQLEKEDKENVTRLCEEGLISVSDRRLSLEQEEIERNFKVSKFVLEKLVNSRLLRAESRVGSVYYELSHDTLIYPIKNIKINRQKKLKKITIGLTISISIALCILLYILFLLSYYQRDVNNRVENLKIEAQELLSVEKKSNEAINKYHEAIKISPKNPYLYFDLGNLYYGLGHYDEAITAFNKTIELDPKLAMAYNKLGSVYSALNQDKEATIAYKNAIELDPKLAISYPNKQNSDLAIEAKLNLQQGMIYTKLKDYDNAIKEFTLAIEKYPGYAAAYSNRAVAYMQKKQYVKAFEDLTRAGQIEKDDPNIYYNLTSLFSVQKKFDLALDSLDKCLEFGFYDYDALRKDPDLANLRKVPEYRKVLEKHKIFMR